MGPDPYADWPDNSMRPATAADIALAAACGSPLSDIALAAACRSPLLLAKLSN